MSQQTSLVVINRSVTPQIQGRYPQMRIAVLAYEAAARDGMSRKLRESGISVWNELQLTPGRDWRLETQWALDEAHFILVLITSHGSQQEGNFQWQIRKALEAQDDMPDGAIKLLPVLLQDMEAPFSLRRFNPNQLFMGPSAWEGLEKSFLHEFQRKDRTNSWNEKALKATWE